MCIDMQLYFHILRRQRKARPNMASEGKFLFSMVATPIYKSIWAWESWNEHNEMWWREQLQYYTELLCINWLQLQLNKTVVFFSSAPPINILVDKCNAPTDICRCLLLTSVIPWQRSFDTVQVTWENESIFNARTQCHYLYTTNQL